VRIHDLPKKWRARADGDAGLLACADELEAHLNGTTLCFVSEGSEIALEVILPDPVFHATTTKASSCFSRPNRCREPHSRALHPETHGPGLSH
jgi:hypothetical protein